MIEENEILHEATDVVQIPLEIGMIFLKLHT